MSAANTVSNSLLGISSRISDEMSEREVESAFLQEGFFSSLEYQGIGHDLRSEWRLPDNSRPDYATLDENQRVTAVYEFKNPTESLSDHVDQLFGYTEELKADFGILTNGHIVRVYRRENGTHTRLYEVEVDDFSEDQIADLADRLSKPRWDSTDADTVSDYISDIEPVSLANELGRDEFYNTFQLEKGSPFGDLVDAAIDLLHELRDNRESNFVVGAYDFWDVSYSSTPENVPESWEPFLEDDRTTLSDFMFCLETGHALLSRLLLAKASDDYNFFPEDDWIERYFTEVRGFTSTINTDAYPVMANSLFEDMREHLVENLFQDDIFSWWVEGYGEAVATQHETPFRQFREIATTEDEITEISDTVRERYNQSVSRVLFPLLKFDFSTAQGDLLGDLYQKYFDPETRKALGEFYTPQEIVDQILDETEYSNGIYRDRLLDPACGSGTFLVEAVERYIQDVENYHSDPDWEQHLDELCNRPRIVGLDVHPFAVLMAQIRFMVAILPKYKIAKDSAGRDEFTIKRLPIFRTDSLEIETEDGDITPDSGGSAQASLDIVEGTEDVHVPVPLPIPSEDDASRFLYKRIRLPLYRHIRGNTGVSNDEDYFATLQGVMDVVKFHMNDNEWKYHGGLEAGVERYGREAFDNIEDFLEPYINELLEIVRELKQEHDDGRLFKMFEDSILAIVIKNYLTYDFVVGNPPWGGILLGSRGALADESFRDRLREDYESAFGRFDIYVPFIERGVDWLGPNGRIGYITQNRFMNRNYGQEIRRILLEETKLETIIDFGDYDEMFDTATNYPCIFVAEKESVNENKFEFITFDDEIHQYTVPEVVAALGQGEQPWILYHSLNQQNLTTDTWSPAKVIASDVIEDVRAGDARSLGDLYNASQGCTIGGEGGEDIYVISEEVVESEDLEAELLEKVLKGGDIEKWAESKQDKYLIYPYDERGNVIDTESYPNIESYLSSHKEMLANRHLDGKLITERNKQWYELWRPRDVDVLNSSKIVTPRLSTKNRFAVDLEGHHLLDSAVGIECPDEHYQYLLGFLNSTWTQLYVNSESTYVQNRYWNYSQTVVESLPIVPPPTAEDTTEYDQIVESVDRLIQRRGAKDRIENFPGPYLTDSIDVDWLDYEWETDRSSIEPAIQERTDGTYAVEIGREHIVSPLMDSEKRANYVFIAVEGMSVDSGEEITIPIPRRDSDVEKVLEELEGDQELLNNIDSEELEGAIDEAVYQLIGLDDDERGTIESCLEMF